MYGMGSREVGGEKESGMMRLSSSSLRLSDTTLDCHTTGAAGTGEGCAAWVAADWAADLRLATAHRKREVMSGPVLTRLCQESTMSPVGDCAKGEPESSRRLDGCEV